MAHNRMPAFGPRAFSKYDLMGIRFATDPEGGEGAGAGKQESSKGGEDFKAPESQEALDAIVEKRLARERANFKDHEKFKTDSAELARLKAEQAKDDPEAKLEGAREEGRSEVRKVLAEERVNNALTAALTGRSIDPNVLVMGFDKSQFIKDGAADTDAIKAWVETNSTEVKQGAKPIPGQGERSSESTGGSVQAGRDLYDSEKKPKRKE